MTKEEAMALLDTAQKTLNLSAMSSVNHSLTVGQGLGIVRSYVESLSAGDVLPHLFEKRVLQVTRNQRRPRMR